MVTKDVDRHVTMTDASCRIFLPRKEKLPSEAEGASGILGQAVRNETGASTSWSRLRSMTLG